MSENQQHTPTVMDDAIKGYADGIRNKDITVIKRNGSYADYEPDKIRRAIRQCFKRCRVRYRAELLDKIDNEVKYYIAKNMAIYPTGSPTPMGAYTIKVEEIQDIVETVLMASNPNCAKEYILYRNHREQVRSWVDSKEEFIRKYKESTNTANATIDDNSNVTNKNIGILNTEIHKEDNIQISRRMVVRKLREIFPDFDAKQYERDLESHIIYKHDESSFAGAVAPYTYSAKEVVRALYNGNQLLVPFDLLYSIIEEPEFLVDSENVVFQKRPDDLYVMDRNDWVRATAITKKKRHRDLYRIKTSFGEDIVVTDNHPLITDPESIDKTVSAVDSLGASQWKFTHKLDFRGESKIDLSDILPESEIYESFIRHDRHDLKRIIDLDESFGYVVGFFIGDGNYNNNNEYLNFTQKDRAVLDRINNILFETTGNAGYIKYDGGSNIFRLQVRSRALFKLFRDYFHIEDKAQGKTLPINILDFTEGFAKGILEGLYDADGTANYNQLWLKLSSRAAILQASELMRHFGYSVGNGIQCLPFNNSGYKTNYSLWTMSCSRRDGCTEFDMSYKWKKVGISKSAPKYKPSGEVKITNVQKIDENDSFLMQNEFIYDITTDSHSFIMNNILVHNCVALTMYPFLDGGIKGIGGLSAKPKNLDSYCGMLVNMIFAISAQFAGACAVPEAILYMDYFARKEWGDDYYLHTEDIVNPRSQHPRTIREQIHQHFQQVVYSINQPAAARGLQSAFVNFSYYDKAFYEGMFGNFVFPDFTKPIWESFNWLQKDFMQWFNDERKKCILTFPVESFAMVYQDHEFLDPESADFVAEEYARGHSFFTYISDTVDSLSSCCRLKNKLQTKEFNFTNGNMGLQTGSKSVITINLNRTIQDWARLNNRIAGASGLSKEEQEGLIEYLGAIVDRIYKYHTAYNELLWDMKDAHLLPVYDAGFIDLNKQYLTIGINGLNQAAEFLGYTCNDNEQYKQFCQLIFGAIAAKNKEAGKEKFNGHTLTFNTEQVPAESLAIKNYNWDKEDDYWVPEDTNLYASYIFKPNDPTTDIFEKLRMHGREYIGDYLDGGSAAHINLEEHLTKDQYRNIIKYAAEQGTNYFTFNIPMSECCDCGHIVNGPVDECPICHSHNIKYWTRIIGYLTAVTSWSAGRREEFGTRIFHSTNKDKYSTYR